MGKPSAQDNLITIHDRTKSERAVLIGIRFPFTLRIEFEDSLQELQMLADTAGAEIVDVVTQNIQEPSSKYLLGEGKVREISRMVQDKKVDLVIFDEELTPAQQRNLEDLLDVRIIDRTALILDIFASRARSREGKLQVELAQLNYILPRLTGKGVLMSRLGGGIGTRGPGETKLEIDRRKIRKRIGRLKKEIQTVKRTRFLHRERRHFLGKPVTSIVGYTNSGKSTLFNRLTNANVLTENKLFATLDPTVRLVKLEKNRTSFIVDTVGFIKKLPHQLVDAFKATFEEIEESDALIHVVDISSSNFDKQIIIVESTLKEMLPQPVPIIYAFNKIDIIHNREYLNRVLLDYGKAVPISALTGEGIEGLLGLLNRELYKEKMYSFSGISK